MALQKIARPSRMLQILLKSLMEKVLFLGGFSLGQMIDCHVCSTKIAQYSRRLLWHTLKIESRPRVRRVILDRSESKN